MSLKFKCFFYLLPLLLYVSFGKYHLVETSKKKYLVKTKSISPRAEKNRQIDFIQNENEPAWLDECSLKSGGEMIQEDVGGCGGKMEMICQGGCLRILKILYSCREQRNSNLLQLELVRRRCEKKEKCFVSSSRDMFGYDECPDALDKEMNLWIVYRCDGGKDRTRITGTKECKTPNCGFCKKITNTPPPLTPPPRTPTPPTPTPPTPPPSTPPTPPPPTPPPPTTPPPTPPPPTPPSTTPPPPTQPPSTPPPPTPTTPSPQRCSLTHGKMVTKDIPLNTGGWINLACSANGARQVPCIFIHKVRAGCAVGQPISGHMTMIKNMCEGKRSCRIESKAEMFSPGVTCAAPIGKRLLWLTYSCDGGGDQTTAFGGSNLIGVLDGIVGGIGGFFGGLGGLFGLKRF